jgi:hypothetical protein
MVTTNYQKQIWCLSTYKFINYVKVLKKFSTFYWWKLYKKCTSNLYEYINLQLPSAQQYKWNTLWKEDNKFFPKLFLYKKKLLTLWSNTSNICKHTFKELSLCHQNAIHSRYELTILFQIWQYPPWSSWQYEKIPGSTVIIFTQILVRILLRIFIMFSLCSWKCDIITTCMFIIY